MEAFVVRCPKEIGGHIKSVVDLAVEFVKHDPNYEAGDDDEDESMEVDDDEEEDDFDDEEYVHCLMQ